MVMRVIDGDSVVSVVEDAGGRAGWSSDPSVVVSSVSNIFHLFTR
jgi:hypothetical protein